jgi:hypothetical protein
VQWRFTPFIRNAQSGKPGFHANRAFESKMKIICDTKNWTCEQNYPAKKLISVVVEHGLVPSYSQEQLKRPHRVLESGVPTIRSKEGGHGKGVDKTKATADVARYALNMTGANILFLVERAKG